LVTRRHSVVRDTPIIANTSLGLTNLIADLPRRPVAKSAPACLACGVA